MEFCRFDIGHNGRLCLVHDQNDRVAVSLRRLMIHSGMTADHCFPDSRRTKFRKQANAADNRAATMSVDSLINYDAVKVRASLFNSNAAAATTIR